MPTPHARISRVHALSNGILRIFPEGCSGPARAPAPRQASVCDERDTTARRRNAYRSGHAAESSSSASAMPVAYTSSCGSLLILPECGALPYFQRLRVSVACMALRVSPLLFALLAVQVHRPNQDNRYRAERVHTCDDSREDKHVFVHGVTNWLCRLFWPASTRWRGCRC